MRAIIAAVLLAPLLASHSQAQQLPQAFLLGSWTGGLFPAPTVLSAEECLAQPTVIFTRDVVMHAGFTEAFYSQRLIETVRGTGTGLEIRFSAVATPPSATAAPGFGSNADTGFGCDSPDLLNIQRISPNEIRFAGCKDYPFPLVRCPAS